MIISKSRNYVFVHIPKTGGTALTLALEDRAAADDIIIGDTPKAKRRKKRLEALTPQGRLWKHSTLADIDGIVSTDELAAMFCVTLVRNPWDRAVSYYHWLRAQDFRHPAVTLAKHPEFEPFIRDDNTVKAFRAWPAEAYMRDAAGVEHCAKYIRIEHLEEDIQPLQSHLGFALNVPFANVSKRARDYRIYYNDSLAEFVGTICEIDVLRFEYRF